MENVEKTKKPDTLAQARKVLGLPYLKDKAICFISSWERTRITPYMPAEDDEKEYIFQELALFESAKHWMQKDGDLSFVAFREFEDTDDDDIDYAEIEKTKKKYPVFLILKMKMVKRLIQGICIHSNWQNLKNSVL